MMNEMIEQFIAAIENAGLTAPEAIEADGEIHRFASNGNPKDDTGWYILFDDGLAAGSFGCWRAQISKTWRANGVSRLSPEERAAYRDRMKAIESMRRADDAKRKVEAQQKAAEIWRTSELATDDHPYLARKGVKAHGLHLCEGELVVRLADGTATHSIQFIDADGEKRFLKGGRVTGCYYPIGVPNGTLCIVEGYATGASVHEATGHAVAVAFNAGNLLRVSRSIRERYPDIRLVICADDDTQTEGNPGLSKAREAAEFVNGLMAIPDFGEPRPQGATDFNDLHRHAGLEAVSECIERAEPASVWPDPRPLPNAIPTVEPFDLAMLPDAFAPWVEDVSDRMQAPPDYAAVGLMVALGTVVGRQIAIRPKATDDWTVVPNLWGGIVGRPGVLKTPSLQEALRPLNKLEGRARDEHEAAIAKSEVNKLVAEARIKNAKVDLRKADKNDKDAHAIAKNALGLSDGMWRQQHYGTRRPNRGGTGGAADRSYAKSSIRPIGFEPFQNVQLRADRCQADKSVGHRHDGGGAAIRLSWGLSPWDGDNRSDGSAGTNSVGDN